MAVDAVVNAANPSLLGGGGVDGAIHAAAGPGLLQECRGLGGCATGEAKVTKGYDLPAKYVIHTVGPVWYGGDRGEEALLRHCYANALSLAEEKGCRSVAFPLISSGAYGYPKREALRVAVEAISAFLQTHEMDVTLVLFLDRRDLLSPETFKELSSRPLPRAMPRAAPECGIAPVKPSAGIKAMRRPAKAAFPMAEAAACRAEAIAADALPEGLPAFEETLDESFSETLLRLIDERGLTDAEVYKRANVDRRHFSKIRSNPAYRPTKATVLSFAVALRLSAEETAQLLSRAGYALSGAILFDVIVEYFLKKGNYDIFEINETLFAYDQPLLGA